MFYYITPVLLLSLITNIGLYFQLKKKPKRTRSIELQEFLADLLSGPGMIAVARVDPSNILLRSPKEK